MSATKDAKSFCASASYVNDLNVRGVGVDGRRVFQSHPQKPEGYICKIIMPNCGDPTGSGVFRTTHKHLKVIQSAAYYKVDVTASLAFGDTQYLYMSERYRHTHPQQESKLICKSATQLERWWKNHQKN